MSAAATCFVHTDADAVREVLFGLYYVRACEPCLTMYRALDVNDPESNVIRKGERDVRGDFACMADVRRANDAIGHGWFERAAMDFFGTKIESGVVRGHYFITSEQPPHGARAFTVRRVAPDGRVETVGEHIGHPNRRSALAALLDAADTEEILSEEVTT